MKTASPHHDHCALFTRQFKSGQHRIGRSAKLSLERLEDRTLLNGLCLISQRPSLDTKLVPLCAADVEEVAPMIDNASAIRDYAVAAAPSSVSAFSGTLPDAGPHDYVIITSAGLAGAFQPLVQHKINRGLTATLVTTDYIYSHFSGTENGDQADKIRYFIKSAHTSWNTQWVLLGGDTSGYHVSVGDASSVVPHRGCYGGSPGDELYYMPTDLYFSCLDGDWDGDHDGIWGEYTDGPGGGLVDLNPDVHLGRAPVSTPTEASNFVNKTIQYESEPSPNPKWAVWAGEVTDPVHGLYGDQWNEKIESECGILDAPNQWAATKLYDSRSEWTGADLISRLNLSPAIVIHNGHSGPEGMARLSRQDVDSLTNAFPYFIYSGGCEAGEFNWPNGDAIAEHHIFAEHGAVAAVMNTQTGHNIGIGSPNYQLESFFWYTVFHGNVRHFGQATDMTRSLLTPMASLGGIDGVLWRIMLYTWTLFGDPETSFADPGQPGSLQGVVYQDNNADGQWQPKDGERGAPGRTVFLDADNDCGMDRITPTYNACCLPLAIPDNSATSSSIEIRDLPGMVLDVNVSVSINHTYDKDLDVYLVNSSGRRVELFTDVGGSGDNFDHTVLDDSAAKPIARGRTPFHGVYRPEGHLSDFIGQDANGVWTLILADDRATDAGSLISWSLTITAGDPSTTTDAHGKFVFNKVPFGQQYVALEPAANWIQTAPSSSFHSVVLHDDETITGLDFGTAKPATISGTKWKDVDGDGTRKRKGEPGLANWTMYLDNNGVYDAPLVQEWCNPGVLAIPDMDRVYSKISVPGPAGPVAGLVLDVDVTLDITHTYDSDLRAYLISPTGNRVNLFWHVGGSGDNFNNTTFSDEAVTSINAGSAPFNGSFRPEDPLSAFDYEDPTGDWKLVVSDDWPKEVGWLEGWTITLTCGDPSDVTDSKGHYQFDSVRPGSYLVREVPQNGWVQTSPGPSRLYGVAPYSGDARLVAIDEATAAAMPIGPTASGLVGLTSDGANAFYALGGVRDLYPHLYSVDPLSGGATSLMSVVAGGFGGFGEGDLALQGNFVYAVRTFNDDSPELYRIDLSNLTTTLVGDLLLGAKPLPAGTQIDGLAFRGSKLYGLVTSWPRQKVNKLITIDCDTRAVKTIGSFGFSLGKTAGMAYDSTQGRFYAVGAGDGRLWKINPATAVAVVVGRTGLLGLSGLTRSAVEGSRFSDSHIVAVSSGKNAWGGDFGNYFAPAAYKWDQQGDGNWNQPRRLDAQGELSADWLNGAVYDALFRTQSVTVPSPLYVFDTTVESGVLVADTGVTPSLQAVGHASPAQQSVDQTRTIVTHSGSSSGAVANASLPKARKEKVTETMRVLARDVVFGRSVSWGLQSWDVPPVRLSGDSWVADLRS